MTAYLPSGSTAHGDFQLDVTPERTDLRFAGLRVLSLAGGGATVFATGEDEVIVLPLSGGCVVKIDRESFRLEGRSDVFTSVSDFAYAPRDAVVEISSVSGGRFALASAPAARALPARRASAMDVPVELRGAGRASRQVNGICSPESFEADRLIAVEVLTPAGNWSSYPPHKHDQHVAGSEIPLEEIYYFEIAGGRFGSGFGYQRVYQSSPASEIDVCAEVRTGDVVLIPHGYHGPSMAPPGYDMYYLNVMAGPVERRWQFQDDPDHAWVRDAWSGEEIDPRLPLVTPVLDLGGGTDRAES